MRVSRSVRRTFALILPIALGGAEPAGPQPAAELPPLEAARRDLVRICSEIREERAETMPAVAGAAPAAPVDPAQRVAGALYVSCSGRGGPHFGGPSAELQIIQHALGDVPLVGFFAAGEIGHHHLYSYTGVLTVFVRDA